MVSFSFCKRAPASDDSSLWPSSLKPTIRNRSSRSGITRWIENRDFEANPRSTKPAFSIVMPPPNITGVLTLGHVLNNTIQDILARRARMQGHEVLWLPGMDHAGIGTQTAVEKYLRRTENENPPRSRAGKISPPCVGMAGQTWRHYHPTTEAARMFLRLVAATLHVR